MEVSHGDSDAVARASALIGIFCPQSEDFGTLRGVQSDDVPAPYRQLLDHQSHMTVAMERFHGGPVSLEVVASRVDVAAALPERGWYAREILLRGPSGDVVQHGIVRIDLGQLDPATAAGILAAKQPLGRLLIASNLLRAVHDVALLEVLSGPHLRMLWHGADAAEAPVSPTFGRVAGISLDGRPAVELLEIAVPGLLPKTLR